MPQETYTVQEFAQKYRQRYGQQAPEITRLPDDQLVQQVIRAHPDFANRIVPDIQGKTPGMMQSQTFTGTRAGQKRVSPPPPMIQGPAQDSLSAFAGAKAAETPGQALLTGTTGANPSAVRAFEQDPSKIGELLAPVAAGIAAWGLGPEAGILKRTAAAGAAGTGGEYLNEAFRSKGVPQSQLDKVLNSIYTGGLPQAGIEAASGLAAKPLQMTLAGALGSRGLKPSISEQANQRFNLGLPAREIPERAYLSAGLQHASERNAILNPIAEAAHRRVRSAISDALSGVSDEVFGPGELQVTGQRVQKDISKVDKPAFIGQVDALRNAFESSANMGGTMSSGGGMVKPRISTIVPMKANVTLMKNAAAMELADLKRASQAGIDPGILAGNPQEALATMGVDPARMKMLLDINKLDDWVNVTDLNNLRSQWMGISRKGEGEAFHSKPTATARYYVGEATKSIDDAVRGTPTETAWKKYRNFTRKGYNAFQADAIYDILKNNPEEIGKSIGPKDVTQALKVRKVLLGYGTKYGDPIQAKEALRSWKTFQKSFMETHIMAGNPFELHTRLNNISPRTLDIIFGSGPQGREAISSLRMLAHVTERNRGVFNPRGGIFYNFIEHLWLKVPAMALYNPQATRYFMRGVSGLLEDYAKQSKVARALGGEQAAKIINKITPRMATALADIGRAEMIYDKETQDNPDEFSEVAPNATGPVQ